MIDPRNVEPPTLIVHQGIDGARQVNGLRPVRGKKGNPHLPLPCGALKIGREDNAEVEDPRSGCYTGSLAA